MLGTFVFFKLIQTNYIKENYSIIMLKKHKNSNFHNQILPTANL
jgi:hypothetical protein